MEEEEKCSTLTDTAGKDDTGMLQLPETATEAAMPF
jgi:hypothetical protein